MSVKRIRQVTAALTFGVLIGCSPSAPSSCVDLTGTWVGTASDAGPVRWTIVQNACDITGTATLVDASSGADVVTGSITGKLVRQTLTFEQSIAFFQFPTDGPWSRYWSAGFHTTGTLTPRGSTQLAGSYIGSAQALRSRPGPKGSGGPFTNGTLTLTRR